jgi:phage shock protein C
MSNLTASQKDYNMTNETPLPLRSDTILGVCEAIGQDFGFNPLWLRLVFVGTIFFAPIAGIATYLGLGLVVAAARFFAPSQPASPQVIEAHATPVAEAVALPMAA